MCTLYRSAGIFSDFYQSAGRTRECVGKSSYTCRKIFHLCQNNEHLKKHVQENFLRIADNKKKSTCRKTSYMCRIKWKYEEHMQETSYMCHIKWKYETHAGKLPTCVGSLSTMHENFPQNEGRIYAMPSFFLRIAYLF